MIGIVPAVEADVPRLRLEVAAGEPQRAGAVVVAGLDVLQVLFLELREFNNMVISLASEFTYAKFYIADV